MHLKMFETCEPRIRVIPQYNVYSTRENDFRVSDKGTYLVFTNITDQGSTSMTLSTLCASKEDCYYEATMTGSNNSIAVGLIPYEHAAIIFDENITGSQQDLEYWRLETRNWDIIALHGWPDNVSYTYHGDTGKIWHNKISYGTGKFLKIGDVVGFGINGHKQELYFTLNGSKLETTFQLKESKYYHPHLSFKGDGSELELNYGREPFVYLLDIHNVIDAWLGANMFQRKMFLDVCEKFIISNWKDIQETESFSRLLRENPAGIATLLRKILNIHAVLKKTCKLCELIDIGYKQ